MPRYANVNKIRAIACLSVLFYHCYALCNHTISIPIIEWILPLGGEIGVTAFFVLSGYGIYSSLYIQDKKQKTATFNSFMRKRFQKLAPHYYFNLFFLI